MSQTFHARAIIFDHHFLSFPLEGCGNYYLLSLHKILGHNTPVNSQGYLSRQPSSTGKIYSQELMGKITQVACCFKNSLYLTGHQTNSFKKELCAPACVLYYFYSKLLLTEFKSLANTVSVLLFPSLLSYYLVNNYISSSLRSCKTENSMQDKYMIKCLTGIYLDSNSRFLL
jgi:hypothetical protein